MSSDIRLTIHPHALKFNFGNTGEKAKLKFTLTGSTDRAEVRQHLIDNVDATYAGLIREDISVNQKEDGRDGHWTGEIEYVSVELSNQNQPTDPDPDPVDPLLPTIIEESVSFDLGGEPRLHTQSLATISSKFADGITGPIKSGQVQPPKDFGGLVNVQDDVVQGAEIDPRSYAQSIVKIDQDVKTSIITNAWINAIEANVHTVNSQTFRDRPAGEVMFLGLSGTVQVQQERSKLSWEFGVRKNVTNATIGVFSAIDKKGWEYAWIYHENRPGTDGSIVRTPISIYIERLFETSAWPGLQVAS